MRRPIRLGFLRAFPLMLASHEKGNDGRRMPETSAGYNLQAAEDQVYPVSSLNVRSRGDGLRDHRLGQEGIALFGRHRPDSETQDFDDAPSLLKAATA